MPDYREYGAQRDRATRLPAGTYYIPMAQAQKHWVQAMLGEDSYVPFPYFYDVTAWSGPLLNNLAGGRSGVVLHPRSKPAQLQAAAKSPGQGPRKPDVGVWLLDPDSTSAYESEGWMRYLYEDKWKLPYTSITSDSIGGGSLDDIDVLVTPGGDYDAAYELLGEDGRAALQQWVADGGRLVSMAGGTVLATMLGLTSATLADPTSDVPGSLIRAKVRPGPLAKGVGDRVWSFYAYDYVMTVDDAAAAPIFYPTTNSPAWFVSGYERGASELARTAVVVDERYGDGRVVAFAGEPNFRGFTDGTQKVLWNAVYGPDPKAEARAAKAERTQAARQATTLSRYADTMLVTVRNASADRVERLLSAYDVKAQTSRLNPRLVQYRFVTGSAEESPYARQLASDLAGLGSGVVSVRLP